MQPTAKTGLGHLSSHLSDRVLDRFLGGLLLLAATLTPAVSAERWGVVLLHGKTATEKQLALYDKPLAATGILSARPQMCWSRQRIYDKSYLDCLGAIDEAIASLKARGATRIVVAGQSLGANAALAYSARHDETIAGVIALAPAHSPEFVSKRPEIAREIERAQQLAASGKGNSKTTFTDINSGKAITVNATPKAYLSFLSSDSPSVMPANAARLKVPLLVVSGTGDRTQRGRNYVFGRAPAHAMSRYVTVEADHPGTPQAGREAMLSWLRDLQQQ
jgi:pimeloyl-ACP methyl ester carboxylesterase